MSTLPIVAITIGDPAGVGPDVVAAALAGGNLGDCCRPLVIGDRGTLERSARVMGVSLPLHPVDEPAGAAYEPGVIDLIDLANVSTELEIGKVQATAGQAAFAYIERATALALRGEVDAIATAPINKEALKLGGVPYLDHTGAFASLTNSDDVTTMFVLDRLKIFFATRHMSLRRAIDDLTRDRVVDQLRHAHEQLERFGFQEPSIALAALNPHGGESGLFGDEEITILAPAVEAARNRGINATGPHPADSVFHNAAMGYHDAVLSLFHDQGHIAAKTLDFDRTIAITTGLPVIRSSVDHGTAFDIAGTGKARWLSMAEAVRVGAEYATRLKEREASRVSMGD
ncbi:MAG: 4-hydroxythreonine-4-phosphate dehydrogenase PdxA [Dehalococcoidia bacterium]